MKRSLEDLLQSNRDGANSFDEKGSFVGDDRKPHDVIETKEKRQAQNCADLDDFFQMVHLIVSKALKKFNVKFVPDEGARIEQDQMDTIKQPHIFFEVIEYEPKLEIKPRVRNDLVKDEDDAGNENSRKGKIFGQKFKSTVQFNIIGCDYIQANKVMKVFEELIFNYTAYFKRQGVAELIFKKRLTDRNLDTYRQKLSVRSLQYYIEIERNYIEYGNDISGVVLRSEK